MATAWTEQQQHAELTALAFDERFGLLVDAEWLRPREQAPHPRPPGGQAASCRRPASRPSTIRPGASSTRPSSASSPPAAGCRSTRRSSSGTTGTGKSFVACALAQQACRKGYRAYYRRASRLFHDLTAGPRRRHLRPPPRQARARRRPRDRRLGPGAGPRPGAPRPARDPRGPLRQPLDHHHQPAAARPSGTTTSPTPPWPTPSAIASSTTPTDSC